MGRFTDIQWSDSTLNLQMGCDGCELWNPKLKVKKCYAGQLTERWGGKKGWPVTFGQPELFLHRLDDALRWPDLTGKERPGKEWLNGHPRLIFLNDMGDTFTESLPLDWLAPLLPRMADSPHRWLLLTKRANRMEEFSKLHPFPKNFWLMTSITCNANENRIAHLLRCEGGSVRGISYEPALERVNFEPYIGCDWRDGTPDELPKVSWIIAGGESGPGARPFNQAWAAGIIRQCEGTDCHAFIKQFGSNPTRNHNHTCYGSDGGLMCNWPLGHELKLKDGHGGDWSEWDPSLRVRQVPKVIRPGEGSVVVECS